MKKLILLLALLALGWMAWHWHQGLDPFERLKAFFQSDDEAELLIHIAQQSLSPLGQARGPATDRERQLNQLTQQLHASDTLSADQLQAADRLYRNLRRLNQERDRFESAWIDARTRDHATLDNRSDHEQRRAFFIQGIERNWEQTVQHYRPLLRYDLTVVVGPTYQQQVMTALHMD